MLDLLNLNRHAPAPRTTDLLLHAVVPGALELTTGVGLKPETHALGVDPEETAGDPEDLDEIRLGLLEEVDHPHDPDAGHKDRRLRDHVDLGVHLLLNQQAQEVE